MGADHVECKSWVLLGGGREQTTYRRHSKTWSVPVSSILNREINSEAKFRTRVNRDRPRLQRTPKRGLSPFPQYKRSTQRIAVTVGDNGFVVGANPRGSVK